MPEHLFSFPVDFNINRSLTCSCLISTLEILISLTEHHTRSVAMEITSCIEGLHSST
uniref:Uncharacterized protein n=2 Tax=Arundo donax TaxID=35708 RepID=A0A0A9FH00_ARUDO